MFDHTTVVTYDDPELEVFKQLHEKNIIQLRIIRGGVGAEKFAEFVFDKVNAFVQEETQGRVKVVEVEFCENNRNSAIYTGPATAEMQDLLTKKYSSLRDDVGAEDWAKYLNKK